MTAPKKETKTKLNKDGLEAGAPVDFETIKRIQAEQRNAKAKPQKDESV